MSSEQNLLTTSKLAEIKTAEAEVIANLSAHANATLSKAHGIIFYYLAHPTLDKDGNDVSIYCDSNGDRAGYYQMRLSYNNVNYFAPLESSTLAGKDPTTGLVPASVQTASNTLENTAWVTRLTVDEQALIAANDDVLLPHFLLSHWETHTGGVYQIFPQAVLDSAGHKVSNYVAKILLDGAELLIPCDPRLGGPAQGARNISLSMYPAFTSPLMLSMTWEPGFTYTGGMITTAIWDGSSPFIVRWQMFTIGNVWVYLTNADGTSTGIVPAPDNRLKVQCTATNGNHSSILNFLIVDTQDSNGGGNNGRFRVEITNADGTQYVEFSIFIHDET